MREPERDYGRLQDIIQAANNILSFTEGHTQEQLSSDKLRYFAVVKNVEIIGEAAYIRMRHVLVHGYATILPELLWHTALVDVPLLKEQVEAIMSGGHAKP